MGRSTTPTFRLDIVLSSGHIATPSTWRVKRQYKLSGYGKPTSDNLKKWVRAFEESTRTGANKHLGPETILYAKISRNCSGGEVMAEYAHTSVHLPEVGEPVFSR